MLIEKLRQMNEINLIFTSFFLKKKCALSEILWVMEMKKNKEMRDYEMKARDYDNSDSNFY